MVQSSAQRVKDSGFAIVVAYVAALAQTQPPAHEFPYDAGTAKKEKKKLTKK